MATTHKSPGNRTVNKATAANGGETRTKRTLNLTPRAAAIAVSAAFMPWIWQPAFADPTPNQLPSGAQVGAGSVTISSSGTKMDVNQASDKAIINWGCFCLGANGWVNFNQPSASSVTLNRSTAGIEIFGRVTAPGQLFFTSGAGVYIGRTAQIDVGGLMATSLSIRDQDFLAGRYIFSKEGSAGEVVNEGTIVAVGGYAALAGPQVRNNGIIIAQAGTVALAAGDRVSLDMIGDGLVKVSVDAAALNALALNAGTLQADGGRVILTARSANALLDTVINNAGVIRATTISERGGEIVLDGGDRGIVADSGTITATGLQTGEKGGNVTIVGQYVALDNGTRIDASGDAGGGTVHVGGNFQGQGPLQNASQTIVDNDVSIKADAVTNGDGGQVVVWSNEATQFFGSISAQGGSNSGNGGNVEVSGKHALNFQGTVSTLAPNGQTGTLLLDPDNLTIRHATTNGPDNNEAGSPAFVANNTANPWVLTDFTINTTLFGSNVTVTTSNSSILITNANGTVALGASNAGNGAPNTVADTHTLTMTSATGISWNAGWSFAGAGQLTLDAQGGNITGTGALTLSGTSPVLLQATTGITATLSGLTTIAATSSGGNVALTVGSAGGVTVDTVGATNGISAAAGDVSVTNNGAGGLTLNQDISGANVTVVTDQLAFGGGAIAATAKATLAPQTAANTITLDAGDSVDLGGGAFTLTGNVTSASLQIGNGSTTGDIAIAGAFDPSGVGTTLTLRTGGGGSIDTAAGGNIIGGTNITSLAMVAGSGGIGATTPIDTEVTSVAASATSGGIHINNDTHGGTLTVTTVDGVAGITSGGSAIVLTEQDGVTVSQAINAGAGTLGILFGQADAGATFTATAGAALTGSAITVTGGAGADVFDFSAAPATTATLGGAAGTDTLIGRNAANTWTINAGNGGSVTSTATTLTFTGMENLTGGSGTDSFTFAAAGSIAGALDGGAGANSISIAAVAGANTINLQAGTISGVVGTTFSNVTAFTGDNSLDTLVGPNANTTWTINAANGGTIAGGFTGSYTGIPNLTGGAADDSFVFAAAGSQSFVNGGAHTTGDTINIAGKAGANTINLQAGTISGGFLGGQSNIESFTGDNAADTIVGTNAATTWNINTANTGTLSTGQSFTNIPNLTGGTAADTFVFAAGGSITAALNGGAGANSISIAAVAGANTINLQAGTISGVVGTTFSNVTSFTGDNVADTLVGTNANTTWNINTANTGTLSTGQSFTNISSLTGGTADDSFVFAAAGTLSGALNGGAHTTGDTLDISAIAGANTINLQAGTISGGVVGGGLSNIESYTGDGVADVLAGTNANTTWNINTANTGTLTGGISFTNIPNLTGGTGDDSFVFAAAGSLTGAVNGGAHTTADTINIAAKAGANTINLQAGTISGGFLGGFSNVESFTGDGAADVLVGPNANTTWNINTANTGTLSTGQSFTNIPNLTGGTADDSFVFAAAGSLTGALDGGAATTANNINIAGKAGANTVDLQAGTISGGFIGSYTNVTSFTGDNAADTIVGTNAATTWTVSGQNDGTLSTGQSFTNIPNLTGGTAADAFVFQAAGSITGALDGGAGANSISIAAVAGANTINLQAGTISGVVGTTFSNVTSFTGDNVADTLVGTNANTTWNINTANTGTLSTGQSFTNISSLTGGTADDSFVFAAAGTLSGALNGGAHTTGDTLDISAIAGANTINLQAGTISGGVVGGGLSNIESYTGDGVADVLAGTNANTTWNINTANTGTLTGGISFTNIPNLTGGTGDDSFVFAAAGSLTGAVNGGAHTTADTINIAAKAGANTINLQAGTISGGFLGGFSNVESFTGDGAADVLVGPNANTTWNINTANTGTLSTGQSFTNIPNLTGGTADDSFVFAAAGSLTGALDGGAATTANNINIAGKAGANTVDLQAGTISGGFIGSYTNVTSFTGDNAADTIVGTNAATTWTVSGQNDGTLSTGQSFTNIPNLTGGTAADAFVFQAAGSITGALDGGAGANSISIAAVAGANTINLQAGTISGVVGTTFSNVTSFTGDNVADTLVGTNANTTWNINTANTGTLSTGQSFTNISSLTGGTADDSFVFAAAGTLSGALNGGAHTTGDTLDISAIAGANTINLQAGTISGGVVGGGLSNIESYTGDGVADVLAGTNANTTWNINTANTGTLTGGISFTNIPNLTGGTGDDSFVFAAAGSLTGAVNGGAHTTADTINIAAKAGANTIDLQAGTISGGFLGGFSNVESFTGDGAADVLVGPNANTTWNINTANTGTLSTGQSFTNIPNLTGGTADDSFVFAAAGSLTGALDGGAATTANNINIAGKAGANTVDLQAGTISGGFIGSYTNVTSFTGDNAADTIVGTNAATTWNINTANTGTLSTGQSFTNIPNLTGGTAADTFVFAAGGSITAALNGGAGANSISIAAVAGANTINLQAGTISGVVGTTFSNVTSFTGDNVADTLVGTNANTTWNINTANTGTLSTGQSFTNISSLTGGTADDSFVFAAAGTLSGALNGGAHTTGDTLDISAIAGANTINLQAGTISGGVVGGGLSNIESYTGDGVADVLAGTNANTTWNINTANTGTLTGGISFTNIPNLTGGTGDDSFVFAAAGSLTGAVNGGAATTANNINIAAKAGANTIDLQAGTISGGFIGSYTNVTSFTGDGVADVLVGPNANTTWNINTANTGTLSTGQSFTNIPNLTGGTGDDSFVFAAAGSLTGALDGGAATTANNINIAAVAGANTINLQAGTISGGFIGSYTNVTSFTGDNAADVIIGTNAATTWTVSGQNDGTLSTGQSFINIPNLTGGSAADAFVFQAAGSITGALNGGGAANSIDIAAVGGANTINLQAGTISGVVGTFSNVTSFTGDNAADVLVGTNGATTWNINTANTGTLSTGQSFTNIPNLTGGTADDSFVFAAAGTLSGAVNGGVHTTGDTINIAAKAGANTINLQAGTISGGFIGSYTNIESYTGDNAADVIIGTNGATTWNINTPNTGTLSTGQSFTNIPNLTGGSAADSFVFAAAGSVTGALDGGGGANNINIAAKAGGNTFNLQLGTISGGFIGSYTNVTSFTGDGAADVLVGTNANTTWNVTGNTGTLSTGQSFTNIPNLTAGTGADTITSLSISGSFNDGGGGTTLNSNVSAGGSITFGGAVTNPGNIDLIITAGGNLTPGIMNVGSGRIQLFAGGTIVGAGQSVTGISALQNVMSSGGNVVGLGVNFSGKTLLLTGIANQWDLVGPPAQLDPLGSTPVFQVGSGATTVFYNGTLVLGAAVAAIEQSSSVIGATLAQIARAALLEAQDTDSVQKQIAYGFAGDVGTTPPMDHRIDETGISVPRCFNDSREGQTCQ